MVLEVLILVLIVSGIAAALAALLVVSESFISNYGSCQVTINGEKKMTVQGGKPLLSTLQEQKVFLPSACGGRGTCGVCKVKILEGGGAVLPTETPFLSKEELKSHVRLSCQVKVRNDIAIEIPEELFQVRQFKCRCGKIEDLTYDMKRFRFELEEPDTIQFVAGQYVQLRCPKYKGSPEEVYRAYSIASDPKETHAIDLIIRRVPKGICTTWCFEYLKEGDSVEMNGPYGEFRLSDTGAPMVFVAGGSGMAPFVSILWHMKNTVNRREAVYFFGGNSVKDLCLQEQMEQFRGDLPNFTFIPVVFNPNSESGWKGQTGLVTEAVSRHYKDLSGHEGYLCGSPGMIDAAAKVFRGLGMPADRIYYDKFA
jgi:Na+-transporting NADH:ubiquinone oxidoreductase subunit F